MEILEVDGGGTTTVAVRVDRDGRIVGFAVGRDSNPLGQPAWGEHVADAVARAGGSADFAVFGLPAYGEVAELSREQEVVTARIGGGHTTVENDVRLNQVGAFAGGPGLLLLAGTGSLCWGVGADGTEARIGGFGDGFGDEGSAFAIGRAALGATSKIIDGQLDGAAFAAAIFAATGGTADRLIAWFYDHPARRPAVAALARIVDRLAAAGDPVAETLLDTAADDLAAHVGAASRKLSADLPWAFVGGVSRSAGMRARVTARVGRPPTAPVLPPVGGALLRAARLAGWPADAAWLAAVARDLARYETALQEPPA